MASRPPDAGVGDPAPDDWLGEETEVDWDDARRSSESGGGATSRLEDSASTVAAGSAEPAVTQADARRRDLVHRRRAIGLVALLGLALVGVGVGLTVIRDDAPSAETTAPVVTAPPPPATPPATTSTTPEEPAPPLMVELPADGRLARGDRGQEVETLQTALAALELYDGEVDGVYGEATQAAVMAFQQANDLTADGIVGADTLEALNAALAEQGVTG
jgi:Putative peptidoglycan binding domain